MGIDAFFTNSIQFGTATINILHTPGHSKGSVCFYLEEQQICFTGDTLFASSIGRTDFEGGDKN